jgi:hypothetical protein
VDARAPLKPVRTAVRTLLERSPAYHQLRPDDRRALANAMVRVSQTAADLILADAQLGAAQPRAPAVAAALGAGEELGGQAVERVAGTTRSILTAVSFERFVTELINGVFGALIASNTQQMHAYTELLDHVAVSTADFTEAATDDDQAKSWLAEQFPESFEAVPDEDADVPEGGRPPLALRVRDGGTAPSAGQVRGVLALPANTSAPTDPDSLVPLARRRIGQQRQQMLATLVTLGMQRIVIDGGKINAAMRFHIDAQSAARQDAGHSTTWSNQMSGSGSFGYGPWSASASVQNSITYVNTEQTQTNEQINASVDLTSSVEILFRSDYVPLNRLANAGQVNQIMANSRNPDAPALSTPTPAFSAPTPLPSPPPLAPAPPLPSRSGASTKPVTGQSKTSPTAPQAEMLPGGKPSAGKPPAGPTQAGQTPAGQTQAGQTQPARR